MIHFEHRGEGPPVLLIQGTGVAGCAWGPQVDALADRYHLAWFDNPGIGGSPGPAGTLGDMVAAAVEVLDALGWKHAHVAGHSLGGVVAQRLALDHPERVRSLALLCTFAQGSSALSFRPAALLRHLQMFVGTRDMRRRAFYRFVSPLEPTDARIEALEQVFGRSLADLPPAARVQLRTLVATDLRAELPSLRTPTLVVGGEHDQPAPVAQTRLLAELLGTSCTVLDAGHALVVEHADVVNGLLADHWSTVEGTRADPG